MPYILGRFKTDLALWKRMIKTHAAGHRKAGLRFLRVWRNADKAREIYFLFESKSLKKSRSFLRKAGALDRKKQKKGLIPELFFLEAA